MPPPSGTRGTASVLGLEWPAHVTEAQRRSLVAGGLGWMLDAMDVMLYSMVLVHLMRDLGMDKGTAGLLNSLTLLASAAGGLLFGFFADRVGRTRALMVSILVYSLASGACGLSTSILQLAMFRFVLGLGMGGEWTTGAALIAETWPAEHRGKALGLMQSTWAIGEMIAAGVVALVLPTFGWRAVFFVGVLPALVVFWIRRDVPESEIWLAPAQAGGAGSVRVLWRKDLRRNGVLATAMNACGMFGYWGLFTWIPAYLSLPVEQGGRGLDLMKTTAWLVIMGVGQVAGVRSVRLLRRFGRAPAQLRHVPPGRGGPGAALRHGEDAVLAPGPRPVRGLLRDRLLLGLRRHRLRAVPDRDPGHRHGPELQRGPRALGRGPGRGGPARQPLRPRLRVLPAGRRVSRGGSHRPGPARTRGRPLE